MMWTALHAQLHQTLRQRHLLPKTSSILVAVSGGQDSLCLAKLLLDLQPKWDWRLGIAHCDHRWRSDSGSNTYHVEEIAAGWNVPFVSRRAVEVPSSEATARQWRYQMLGEIAQEGEFDRIVTGHTQSDRAETLLYNLIRGSGTDGLTSLTWRRELVPGIELVRPLLEVSRAETGEFCRQQQLEIWEDSTNADLSYARNRIRGELLPYLQNHFNPNAEKAIAQTAELLRADVEYLESTAADLLARASLHPRMLHRPVLRAVPLALQRRAMRQFLSAVLPHAPSFEHIEKMTALITAPNKSRTDPFPGGAIAEVDGEAIVFRDCNNLS
ncbi:MAG: tRNA lysidine(34) synthetase TilS [Cyanobacteriota bacterium]|nr:tRNA lysidine(34) synthetase TilS [Cyanobacteriota bacterium]